jgi:hypothetical protein
MIPASEAPMHESRLAFASGDKPMPCSARPRVPPLDSRRVQSTEKNGTPAIASRQRKIAESRVFAGLLEGGTLSQFILNA